MDKLCSFNTQPPEGGCSLGLGYLIGYVMFQHTAARRRLPLSTVLSLIGSKFQHTAARRRLPSMRVKFGKRFLVSTHSRPKAAAKFPYYFDEVKAVSTHSRPKAAATRLAMAEIRREFQHTAARRRLHICSIFRAMPVWFQHTAARRRLLLWKTHFAIAVKFQHTAARRRLRALSDKATKLIERFNTQPPEGGCFNFTCFCFCTLCFNTQPPEGGCFNFTCFCFCTLCFNTQPPEGGCQKQHKI